MPQSEYIKFVTFGIDQNVHYTAMLLRCVKFGSFMQHGIEQMYTLVACGLDIEQRLAEVNGQSQLT